jgi:uncharacterized protein YbjT (DUF2867 family)
VHATQFFEFVGSIAGAATVGDTVRLAAVRIQPVAADDVAAAVARTAVGAPIGGIIEVAGPAEYRLDELIRKGLAAEGDARTVVVDDDATYFGAHLREWTLTPGDGTAPAEADIVGETRFEDWLSRSVATA